MLGNLSFKMFTTPLMKKFRFKPLILLATLISIPLTLALGLTRSSLPFTWLAILLLITGGVRSLGMTFYNTITFADTDQEIMSHANTLSNMVQQLSSVIAVATAVIAINLGRVFVGVRHEYTFAFSFAIVALVISLWDVISLPQPAGDSLRK